MACAPAIPEINKTETTKPEIKSKRCTSNSPLGIVQALATAQNTEGLPQPSAAIDERIRRRGVELKHIEMARNRQLRADVARQLGGFRPGQIASHAPLRSTAVNRKQRDVDGEGTQLFR